MAPARPTLEDVAAAAGVSRSTVSNAFNRPDQLSAERRLHVLAVAQRLGYGGPDPRARSLRRGRTGAIGFLFDAPLPYLFNDPAAVLLLEGVAQACQDRDLGLVLVPELRPGSSADVVSTALVDGFIAFCDALGDERRALIAARQLPVVALDSPAVGDEPFVGIDDRGGARAVAAHLLALGHRHLGVVSLGLARDTVPGPYPEGLASTSVDYLTTVARLTGYRDALEGSGLAWADVPVEFAGVDIDAGRRAGSVLLERTPRPTAILAMSDVLALGVLAAARERGLAVPEQLSVVGFDDVPAALTADPPLTTVHQPHADKGVAAVALLVDGEPPSAPVILPTELIVRASTAPAPERAPPKRRAKPQ